MPKKEVYDVRCECFKDLPVRGLLHIMIIDLLCEGDMYGAEIYYKIKEKYCIEAPKAIIYSLLRRMERAGYLKSTWDVEGGGPARRIYSITQAGENYYEKSLIGLEKLKEIIEKIIG